MAKIYSQLEKAQLENTTSDTGSLPKGMITYRTDLNIAKVSDGTSMLALIDESSTQTLSGKTYASPITTGAIQGAQIATPANPSAGNNKLYFKADGKLYTLDSSGNEAAVGSGTGGVKNLITNGNADDTASSIFVPYADTGTRPVDGTGGSPTVTTSITTTTPLDGVKSFLLTKPASNVQGQGWAVPFTVDPAYRAKSLKISVDYIVNSGTFVAGGAGVESDVIWYIYDVTNSQLIEPSNIKMFSNSSSLTDKFEATFQSSATGSSYRLIAHVQSTSALAYELKVDNITVSPQSYVFGTPVTDWQSFVPTGTWTTNTTYSGLWRRVGDSMEINVLITLAGAPNAATLALNMPTGYVIDTTKIASADDDSSVIGHAQYRDSGTGSFTGPVAYTSSTTMRVKFIKVNSANNNDAISNVDQATPMTWAAGDRINIQVRVPIVGWSSSVQTSDNADTRVVAAHGYDTGSTVYNSNATRQQMPLDTALFDTHGMISGNVITIPVSGYYEISGKALWSGANMVSGGTYELLITTGSVGGTIVAADDQRCAAAGAFVTNNVNMTRFFNAGTILYAVLNSSANHSVNTVTIDGTAAHWSYLSVTRVTGPSAIAASESVNARYTSSAGQSIPNNSTTLIDFGTKDFDSHNAVTTGGSWKFTAPIAGVYSVSATTYLAFTASSTVSSETNLFVHKNGTQYALLGSRSHDATNNSMATPSGTTLVKLNAGDFIDIRMYQNNGATKNLSTNAAFVSVSISKVGN